jgi:hypothetical protein
LETELFLPSAEKAGRVQKACPSGCVIELTSDLDQLGSARLSVPFSPFFLPKNQSRIQLPKCCSFIFCNLDEQIDRLALRERDRTVQVAHVQYMQH